MHLRRAGGLILIVAAFALASLEGAAFAHHPDDAGTGAIPKSEILGASSTDYIAQRFQAVGQQFPTDTDAVARAAANPGPCTDAARTSMPDGAPHDHQEISQHKFDCAVKQSEFLPLKDEITRAFGREDVILGEGDVKADIAAVAVTFPRSGVVFFDVKDPSKPKFLSIYRGGECDAQPIDINCGAFVDIAADGKAAYLSVQNLSSVPDPSLSSGRPGTAGVEVLSLADPKTPTLVQIYSVSAGVTGTHTSRSHVIPAAPQSGPNGPRAAGEYLFSNQNSVGVNIAKIERLPNGIPQVRFINLIEAPDLHDTFIQNDPLSGRTYLYLADGFGEDGDGTAGTAFVVYDVTDPAAPKRLAQWDLTPECERDWYSHTIDVTTRNGRRFVTMPSELFVSGNQSDADTKAGCGKPRETTCGALAAPCTRSPVGNGNVPGPMWIVDATDLSTLAQASDSEADIKRKSEEALVTTWTNPAGRAGGNLTFSPHNQQIVGDTIYVSQYHGGVYKLDASKAFDGVKESNDAERPREVGFVVPHSEPTRKNVGLATNPLVPFITAFPFGHPEIWDTFFYRGCTLTPDETGGFYSFEFDGDQCTAASGGPAPSPTPVQSLGPIAGPPKARDRFVIRRRTRRVDTSRVLRTRVLCKSAGRCSGVLSFRTTGSGRSLFLGKRSFVLAPRANRLLQIRVSRSHLRVLGKRRTTGVRALARVRFGNGKAGRAVLNFRLATSRGVQRRSR